MFYSIAYYLLAVLLQDIIKLFHQMVTDDLSGANVFKLQQHVKGIS